MEPGQPPGRPAPVAAGTGPCCQLLSFWKRMGTMRKVGITASVLLRPEGEKCCESTAGAVQRALCTRNLCPAGGFSQASESVNHRA